MTGADVSRLAPLLPALDRLIEAVSPESKEAALRPLERRLRRPLVAMWQRQRRLVVERLEPHAWRFAAEEATRVLREAGPIPDNQLDGLWGGVAAATAGQLPPAADQLYAAAVMRGYRAAARETRIGLSFSLEHPLAVEFLTGRGAALVSGINDVTRDRLRTVLVRAGSEGWSYQRTAGSIRTMFDGFGGASPLRHIRDRAELVAVTEMGMAYEHGQRMVIAELADEGTATEKGWLSAEDERVCDICQPAADQGHIPSGEQFVNGLDGPLGHPGCRCALTLQVAAESRV